MNNTLEILTILQRATKELELTTKVLAVSKTQSLTRNFFIARINDIQQQLNNLINEENKYETSKN